MRFLMRIGFFVTSSLFFAPGATAEIRIVSIEGLDEIQEGLKIHYGSFALRGHEVEIYDKNKQIMGCKVFYMLQPNDQEFKTLMSIESSTFKDLPKFLQKIKESGLELSDVIVTVNGNYIDSCIDAAKRISEENKKKTELGIWVD